MITTAFAWTSFSACKDYKLDYNSGALATADVSHVYIVLHVYVLYFYSENWDVRDGNLKKQAHLLSKAELKRRGITRYDAEIILAQGQSLPEPKVNLGSKLPPPVCKNQPVKVSELRLSPRKHISSQSYLKSLSPDQVIAKDSRTRKREIGSPSCGKKQEMGRHIEPLADITSIKSEKQHSGSNEDNNKSFVNKCTHRAKTRSQKNGHRDVLKLDLDCVEAMNSNQRENSGSGIRQSPRLRNKEMTHSSMEVKTESGKQCRTNVTVDTGDPEISFRLKNDSKSRNIFTQLQLDVSNIKQEVESDTDCGCDDDDECEEDCRSRLSNQCPTLLEHLRAPPSDMPHLIPYDSDPQDDTSYKNSRVRPKLTSYQTSEHTDNRPTRSKMSHCKHSKKSPLVTNTKSIRQSPRNKRYSGGNSLEQCSLNGVNGSIGFRNCDVKQCTNRNGTCVDKASLGTKREAKLSPVDAGATNRSRKGNKYKGGNVFDKFNQLSEECCSSDDSKAEVFNGSHKMNMEAFGDHVTVFNGSRSSPRFKHHKGRKRRLSFGDVASPKFGEPLRKRIDTLNRGLAEYRSLFANISPVKKIPKITIKMRKDPVLEKELENITESENGVHFKLESPRNSAQNTPDSSDMSDSDEEESPLNCTKFRPKFQKSQNGVVSLFKNGNEQDMVCPKLMKIKFGGTQININIPQQS